MTRRGVIAAMVCLLLGFGATGNLRAGQIEADRFDLPATAPGQTAFQTINFRQSFQRTPLIFITPTEQNAEPAAIRIRNVTATGFEVVQVEAPGGDGPADAMTNLSYIAVEPGRHALGGGMVIEAFAHDTTTTVRRSPPFPDGGGHDTISFRAGFAANPTVIGMVQTDNNEQNAPPGDPSSPWMTISVVNAGTDDVQIAIEQSEVDDGNPVAVPERVGYLAVTRDDGTLIDSDGLGVMVNALLSANNVDHNTTLVPFDVSFAPNTPLVVAGKTTRDGADGGWIRIDSVDADGVRLAIEEDVFNDGDQTHTSEQVGVIAIERAFDAVLATLDADITWQGAAADWATAANWDNWDGTNFRLASGDQLIFDDTGAATPISSVTVAYEALLDAITFSGSTAYTIGDGGGSFRLADGAAITNQSDQVQMVDAAFAATGDAATIDAGSAAGGAFVFGPNAAIDLSHSGGVELIFTGDNDTTVSGGVHGDGGRLTKIGGGTLTLAGASTHTGATDIRGGGFAVGAGIDAASVGGSFRLRPGAAWTIDIDPTQPSVPGTSHDVLDAAGPAQLDAGAPLAVNLLAGPGALEHGQRWVVLRSPAGIVNAAAALIADFGLLHLVADPAFSDGDASFAVVATRAIFQPRGQTANNRSVGGALDSLNIPAPGGATAALLTTLDAMDTASLNRAMRQFSPESTAAVQFTQQRATSLYHRTIMDHLRSPGGGAAVAAGRGPGGSELEPPMLASASDDPFLLGFAMGGGGQATGPTDAADRALGDLGLFARGVHMTHRRSTGGDHAGYAGHTSGGQVGVDAPLRVESGSGLRLGAAFAYTRTGLDFHDGLGDVNANTFRLGPYIGVEQGAWFGGGSVSYALHTIDQRRNIDALSAVARSDRLAHELTVNVHGGLNLPAGRWRVQPSAGVDYTLYHANSYDESGAGLVDLHVAGRTEHEVATRLGVAVARDLQVGGMALTGRVGGAWRHQWTDEVQSLSARFAAGGERFTVDAVGPQRDVAVAHAELSADAADGGELFVRYDAWLADAGDRTHAISAGVRLRF